MSFKQLLFERHLLSLYDLSGQSISFAPNKHERCQASLKTKLWPGSFEFRRWAEVSEPRERDGRMS
jgi:hypothetical protein